MAEIHAVEDGLLDIFDPEFLARPWLAYAAARAGGPVMPTQIGPIIIGYDEVDSLLRDRRFRQEGVDMLRMQGITDGPVFDWWSRSLITTEGDFHTRLRRTVAPLFTPDAVSRLARLLDETATELVGVLPERGTIDVATQVCAPFAARVMCALLGIDASYEADLGAHCARIGPIVSFDVAARLTEITDASAQLTRLIGEVVDRSRGTDAAIAQVVQRAEHQFDWPEIVGLLIVVLFSGHEALRFQLASAIEHLAESPDQWAALCEDPALAANATTECLRFDPVFPAAARVATEGGFTVAGLPIDAGTIVYASTGAANRDPARFTRPDEFDVREVRDTPPLVFGAGPHYCLGAALGTAALEAVLRCRDPRVADGGRGPGDPTQHGRGPVWPRLVADRVLAGLRGRCWYRGRVSGILEGQTRTLGAGMLGRHRKGSPWTTG